VRPATAAISRLQPICRQVHGFERDDEVLDAIGQKTRRGRASRPDHRLHDRLSFDGHTVAESNHDLMALIGAATEFAGRASCCRRATTSLRLVPRGGAAVGVPDDADDDGFYNEPQGRGAVGAVLGIRSHALVTSARRTRGV